MHVVKVLSASTNNPLLEPSALAAAIYFFHHYVFFLEKLRIVGVFPFASFFLSTMTGSGKRPLPDKSALTCRLTLKYGIPLKAFPEIPGQWWNAPNPLAGCREAAPDLVC